MLLSDVDMATARLLHSDLTHAGESIVNEYCKGALQAQYEVQKTFRGFMVQWRIIRQFRTFGYATWPSEKQGSEFAATAMEVVCILKKQVFTNSASSF